MGKITGLKMTRSRDKRVSVYVDGEFAFSLLAEVVLKEGLKTGQELTAEQMERLNAADSNQRCYNAAIRFLGYRPRSESEVRQRLRRRGFSEADTGRAMARLKELGLVDDAAFARFWKHNLESFSPRSRRLTRLELQRKGIDASVIDSVVAELDDSDSAYRAALGQARRLSPTDYEVFRRRLGAYLGRRGFGYGTIRETVEKVWKEYGNG